MIKVFKFKSADALETYRRTSDYNGSIADAVGMNKFTAVVQEDCIVKIIAPVKLGRSQWGSAPFVTDEIENYLKEVDEPVGESDDELANAVRLERTALETQVRILKERLEQAEKRLENLDA
ncbi:MAG: hypothetical protein [Caudoviricetes sp.]|nr:MAG: hypothetical protein [Caudoviricetes sp.]